MIEATKKKLNEAQFFFSHLSIEGRPLASGDHFNYYLSAFLSAAVSVINVLMHECQHEFKGWYRNWKSELSEEDLGLLESFRRLRRQSVHMIGVKVVVGRVEIPLAQFLHEMHRRGADVFIRHSVPGIRPPNQLGKVHTFPALGDQEVIAVCRRFLDLLSRLVSDFERDVKSWPAFSERN